MSSSYLFPWLFYRKVSCLITTVQLVYVECLHEFCFNNYSREFSQEKHVTNTGLLEVAERKGIVMIFPQAKSSDENPIGCWDTFGMAGLYYGELYFC